MPLFLCLFFFPRESGTNRQGLASAHFAVGTIMVQAVGLPVSRPWSQVTGPEAGTPGRRESAPRLHGGSSGLLQLESISGSGPSPSEAVEAQGGAGVAGGSPTPAQVSPDGATWLLGTSGQRELRLCPPLAGSWGPVVTAPLQDSGSDLKPPSLRRVLLGLPMCPYPRCGPGWTGWTVSGCPCAGQPGPRLASGWQRWPSYLSVARLCLRLLLLRPCPSVAMLHCWATLCPGRGEAGAGGQGDVAATNLSICWNSLQVWAPQRLHRACPGASLSLKTSLSARMELIVLRGLLPVPGTELCHWHLRGPLRTGESWRLLHDLRAVYICGLSLGVSNDEGLATSCSKAAHSPLGQSEPVY